MARPELATPSPPKAAARRVRASLGRLGDRIVLGAHRLADRFDLVPPEFGRDAPVDQSDGRSVRIEWLRHFKLWAAYNPEEIFALKVGGGLLAAALIALWLAIAILL